MWAWPSRQLWLEQRRALGEEAPPKGLGVQGFATKLVGGGGGVAGRFPLQLEQQRVLGEKT